VFGELIGTIRQNISQRKVGLVESLGGTREKSSRKIAKEAPQRRQNQNRESLSRTRDGGLSATAGEKEEPNQNNRG
jgi:hypothetical protein